MVNAWIRAANIQQTQHITIKRIVIALSILWSCCIKRRNAWIETTKKYAYNDDSSNVYRRHECTIDAKVKMFRTSGFFVSNGNHTFHTRSHVYDDATCDTTLTTTDIWATHRNKLFSLFFRRHHIFVLIRSQ